MTPWFSCKSESIWKVPQWLPKAGKDSHIITQGWLHLSVEHDHEQGEENMKRCHSSSSSSSSSSTPPVHRNPHSHVLNLREVRISDSPGEEAAHSGWRGQTHSTLNTWGISDSTGKKRWYSCCLWWGGVKDNPTHRHAECLTATLLHKLEYTAMLNPINNHWYL